MDLKLVRRMVEYESPKPNTGDLLKDELNTIAPVNSEGEVCRRCEELVFIFGKNDIGQCG